MESVIIKIVVDDAVADAEVLIRVLDDGLLEVGMELKNLSVVLEPLGCDSGNGIVDLGLARRNALEGARKTFAHRRQKFRVHIFLQVHGFLADSTIPDTEELGLVITRDGRVRISVSREERQLLGKV